MTINRFSSGTNSRPEPAKPMRGVLLVATPKVGDGRFQESVVLLMQHDKAGSFGVALNKPADQQVQTAWNKLTGHRRRTLVEDIFAGGPLNGPVLAIHQIPALADAEIPGGLHVSAQFDKVTQLISQFTDPYRIVVGIAGWKPGQLETEIESGMWYLLHSSVRLVFQDPIWMWHACLQECGRQQILALLGRDHFPSDPSLN